MARPLLRGRLRSGRIWLSESEVLSEFRRRWQRTVVLAALTGVLTGLGVYAFEWVTTEALERVVEARLAVEMIVPGVGLLGATLALRYLARRASPALSDEYVNYFHDRYRSLPWWPVGGRMVAGAATVGGGGGHLQGPTHRCSVARVAVRPRCPHVRCHGLVDEGAGEANSDAPPPPDRSRRLAGLAAASYALYDRALTLGPGYDAVAWAADAGQGLGLVALLFLLRGVSTGGLSGARSGDSDVVVPADRHGGVPRCGLPHTDRRGGVRGRIHRPPRLCDLGAHRRLRLPITAALLRDVHTVHPTTTLKELVEEHMVRAGVRAIPVVNDGRNVGMVSVDEVERVPREEWGSAAVADVMVTAPPPAELSWNLRRAIAIMDEHGISRLAVTDHGRFVGVVTHREILRLDEILDETDA